MNDRADGKSGEPQQPSLVALLSSMQGALAVVGIFVYGALYISYAYFYDQLGLRPEDVGLNYGTTIARSSGLILLVVIPIIAVFLFTRRRRRPTLKRTPNSTVDLLMPASLRSSGSLPVGSGEAPSSLEESIVVVVPASLKTSEPPPDRGAPPPTRTSDLKDWVLKVSVGLLLVNLAFVLSQVARLPHEVTSRAADVEAGTEVSPLRLGPLTILDITAHRARITWIDNAASGSDLNT
jgi:hypothetical protein